MNRRRLWMLMATPSLAVAGLLFALLSLGQGPARAAGEAPTVLINTEASAARAPSSGPANSMINTAVGHTAYQCSEAWVTETVDSAGNVGSATSLALEPVYPYTPHIAYYDVANDDLKYAQRRGTAWYSQTVDTGGGCTSLALVPTYPYTPCITYYDGASPNFWEWFLKYTCREGTAWSIMALSSNQRAGQSGVSLALAPAYPYTPHVSYYNPWGTTATLHHAYLSGTDWMSGTWVHEQVEPAGSRAGTSSSLALEPTYPYTPHISYHDRANLDLNYARLSGSQWLSETVDSTGEVGWYTSLALDSQGHPHVSYYDSTNSSLKYAWLSGTTWLSETVDSTGQPSYVRGGTSLKLDRADTPYISYYDATHDELKLAQRSGTGWVTQTVDSTGDVGSWSSLALDGHGCPHISYYDADNGDLKYAYQPVAVFRSYLPVILKGY